MTGKPVHTRLAGLASHAVLSSTCKIAVSPLNPTSESARTFRRLPAASVNWLLRESGSGASTASTVRPRFDLHAATAFESSQLCRFFPHSSCQLWEEFWSTALDSTSTILLNLTWIHHAKSVCATWELLRSELGWVSGPCYSKHSKCIPRVKSPHSSCPDWEELYRSDRQAGPYSPGWVGKPCCSVQHLQNCRVATKSNL